MMQKKFMLVLFLLGGSILFCGKRPVHGIKIMTFNIRYGTAKDGKNSWENRQSILLRCLKKYKPDILGTQEALGFQVDSIKASFPQWKVIGVGRYFNVPVPNRPHESKSGESCKIFYDITKYELVKHGTYWHSDTPDVPASRTWGNDLPRITTWGIFRFKDTEKKFAVMNTHFHWDEPYVSNAANLILRKWQKIADSIPTILMGDFNLEPNSKVHELFCRKIGTKKEKGYFVDCWQALGISEANTGTSNNFSGIKTKSRIDWILCTPEFDVKNINIIYYNESGHYPSDHYPVMAKLQYVQQE